MPASSPFFLAATVLLGLAGMAKAARPLRADLALAKLRLPPLARWAGGAEILVAVYAIARGDRLSAALVTAAYLGFAVVAWRLAGVARGADCGCFGAVDSPVGLIHVVANVVVAVGATTAIVVPPGSVTHLADEPWSGVPLAALTALLVAFAYVSFTSLPALLQARAALNPEH